ncbi:MAG: aldehyde dehydrogenase family protein [Alphaproteobacteria bacterium]
MRDPLKLTPESLFVGGEWRAPVDGGQPLPVVNPATEETITTVQLGSAGDADAAVGVARGAFPAWSATPLLSRLELMERVCAVYERRMPEIARAVTTEMGAPYRKLALPRQAAVGLLQMRSTIAAARSFSFDWMLNRTTRIRREPVGVCAMITPWNWPLNQMLIKVAPALATGCTMVVKPSPYAALSATLVAEVMAEAGVPPGVFNLVHGEAPVVTRLASHPLVDMVSLTGSNPAGAAVSAAAAPTIKRVSLELGGKSPNIILPGADITAAVAHGVRQMMSNSGQSCNAPSRMLVSRSRLQEAEKVARAIAEEIVVGDPLADATELGPIANARQYERVQSLIATGSAEGARLVTGGLGRPTPLSRGFFARPTIFSDVTPSMTIAREEIFGPVLVLIPYDTEDDAVTIANDTPFGLSAYIYGATREHAIAVGERMRTGMVHINGTHTDIDAPFGGYKQSGHGREWGAWGLEDYLETKAMMGIAGS